MIEILHTRDSDDGCEHTVFVDGKRAPAVVIEDVDPGRGYTRAEWDEHTEWIGHQADYTEAFRAAVIAERVDADSTYITEGA